MVVLRFGEAQCGTLNVPGLKRAPILTLGARFGVSFKTAPVNL